LFALREDDEGLEQMNGNQKPAMGLRGRDKRQGDLSDVEGGTFDRRDRADGRQSQEVGESRAPHDHPQGGVDARNRPVPPGKDPLPAGLAHREGPMNKSTGRHTVNPKPDQTSRHKEHDDPGQSGHKPQR
jgi:hypothetical protein